MSSMGQWDYYKEMFKYLLLKMLLGAYLVKIRVQSMFGIKASKEELQDFDLDYNE